MNRKPIPFGLLVHVAPRRGPTQSEVVRLLREKKALQAQLLECQSSKLRWPRPVGMQYVSEGIPSEVEYLRREISRHLATQARLQVENSSLRSQIADLRFQKTMSPNHPGPIIHETSRALPSIRQYLPFVSSNYKEKVVAHHGMAPRTPREDLRKAAAAYDQSFDRMMSALSRYIRYERDKVRRRVVKSTAWRSFMRSAVNVERGFSAGMQRVAMFVDRTWGAILWAILFSLIVFLAGAAVGLLLVSPASVEVGQMNPPMYDATSRQAEHSTPGGGQSPDTMSLASAADDPSLPVSIPTAIAPQPFEEHGMISSYTADNIPIWGRPIYVVFDNFGPKIVAFQHNTYGGELYYMSYTTQGSVRVVEHFDDSCNWNSARPLDRLTDSGFEFYPMGVMVEKGQVVGVYVTNRRECIANEKLVYPYERP